MNTSATSNACVQTCAVCEQKGTMRCSACHSGELYCSRACQKLLWPAHKHFCGADPAVFSYPPLVAGEVRALDLSVNREFGYCSEEMQGKTLLPFLKDEGLFDGSWEELLNVLADPAPSLPEPDLTILRAFAHLHIGGDLSLNLRLTHTPWQNFSTLLIQAIFTNDNYSLLYRNPSTKDAHQCAREPLRVFNAYLRQVLVLYALEVALVSPSPPPTLRREMFDVGVQRAQDCIAALDVPKEFQDNLCGFRPALEAVKQVGLNVGRL
ncbi:hypothetical protein JCM10213_007888 [Rhodosporidiobolus nylandii]